MSNLTEPNLGAIFPDARGWITTMSINGPVDPKGAFFQSLGSNGRSCATCHVASQRMSISSSSVRQRFRQSQGADPLLAAIDGGNCPNSRAGSPQDHSLLLKNGLIRVFMAPPANAEFSISVIHPFGPCQPESFYTTDPAKALVTGLCSDFNRGKGPILRGLAARALYFHNGAAASLHELVNVYDKRFQMGLTETPKRQLEAFLDSL
jgi:hypothetical protein